MQQDPKYVLATEETKENMLLLNLITKYTKPDEPLHIYTIELCNANTFFLPLTFENLNTSAWSLTLRSIVPEN